MSFQPSFDICSVFKDIAQLLDSPEGKETADVLLRAENSTHQFPAHRIILCVRAEFFRRRLKQMSAGTLEVVGVTSDAVLREVHRVLLP